MLLGELCGSVQVSRGGQGMSLLRLRWHRQGWDQLASCVLILLSVLLPREKLPKKSKFQVTRLLEWKKAS